MSNLIKINNKNLVIKELEGKRVVTFKDIDNLHERAEGTASRNFRENRDKFINQVDYFEINRSDVGTNFVGTYGFNKKAPNGILVTESGYLMLVKSLTDDLAWKVQRQLVDSYFRGKHLSRNLQDLSPQLQLLIQMELKQSELEVAVTETRTEVANIKENIISDSEDWRKWVNNRIRKIGAMQGNYQLAYEESYKELQSRAGCDLDRRISNKRGRMFKAGASNSAMGKVSNLDVIEEDKQLKEIYTSIVKEMCVKYL